MKMYTGFPRMSPVLHESLALDEDLATDDQFLALKHESLKDQYRAYFQETLSGLHVAGAEETNVLQEWVEGTQATADDVRALSEFWSLQIRSQLKSGRDLRAHFDDRLQHAYQQKWMNTTSMERWVKRFEDPLISYKQREYFMKEQWPAYEREWQRVQKDREDITKHPRFSDLLASNPSYSALKKGEDDAFLSLHFHTRDDLLKEAQAHLLALDRDWKALFTETKQRLLSEVQLGSLSSDKVGRWLARVFHPKATIASINHFLHDTQGRYTLHYLSSQWTLIRMKYDRCSEKFAAMPEWQKPRGLRLIPVKKFLFMHFRERELYIDNLETRLTSSFDTEHPDFIRIRHVMDMKEWEEASELIATLRENVDLPPDQKNRLETMSRYVQHLCDKQRREAQEQQTGAEAIEQINGAMVVLKRECPEEVDKVYQLLESPSPNLAIANFYWISYNHIWCRDHFYLTDDVAAEGASSDVMKQTKERAEHGDDVGMHDHIDRDTAGRRYFRDEEFARKQATYQHVNVSNFNAQEAHREWLLKEHTYKEMYWTNYCAHSDHKPHSEGWHRSLTSILRTLRSATRTLEQSGTSYTRPST